MDHFEISRDLVITAKTVEKAHRHILAKLGVIAARQAIALALQQEPIEQPTMVSLTPIDGGRARPELGARARVGAESLSAR